MNVIVTQQQARTEAERCLYCFDAPCSVACPVHIDIPGFIAMVKSSNLPGAAKVIRTSHALASVCGNVCPEEVFCQAVCTRAKNDAPIAIRELHLYATRHEQTGVASGFRSLPASARKVAVVGGGPAGLGCAFELSKFGYEVHVFDPAGAGGVPKNSIPAARLAEEELLRDLQFLRPFFRIHESGIDGAVFDRLRKDHEAVFLAIGLGRDKNLGVPGEHLKGVLPVLEFLQKAKTGAATLQVGDRVAIIGGGNVSLDAAATAKRLGAREVVLLYRRSEREMRVWKSELEEAKHQGVEIRFLVNPVEILGDGMVKGVKCRHTRLSQERDKTGRHIPVEIEGSDFVLDADTVIIAIGQSRGSCVSEMTSRPLFQVCLPAAM
jgi:NADPH-dependent glutamate synthase beta subunit-like oxidoreductase